MRQLSPLLTAGHRFLRIMQQLVVLTIVIVLWLLCVAVAVDTILAFWRAFGIVFFASLAFTVGIPYVIHLYQLLGQRRC